MLDCTPATSEEPTYTPPTCTPGQLFTVRQYQLVVAGILVLSIFGQTALDHRSANGLEHLKSLLIGLTGNGPNLEDSGRSSEANIDIVPACSCDPERTSGWLYRSYLPTQRFPEFIGLLNKAGIFSELLGKLLYESID
jgi:hypothetical protein